MSHAMVDPGGSKAGPGRVQTVATLAGLAALEAHLRRRYPRKMAEAVASDTGIAVDTIRKWFFRRPQRRPDLASRRKLAAAYGPELAAAAGIELARWREAFLVPEDEADAA